VRRGLKNSVSPLKERSLRRTEKRPSFSGAAWVKKLGLSPERTEPSINKEETEFFGYGAGKKLGLSPERTEPATYREETEFFRCGVG
jgi:hypothetical protein